jgi:7-cyano-7-deazaguanine reductase
MEKFKGNIISVLNQLQDKISIDLSLLLKTDVLVYVRSTTSIDDGAYYPPVFPNSEYPNLELEIDVTMIQALSYSENPNLLNAIEIPESRTQRFHSALLKSNCRVTSQPDWGDVYIHYKGRYEINKVSLLQYIISFRDECHFHEEICETIYKRFYDKFNPEELVVSCLYVRRGGIDINPTRASSYDLLDRNLVDKFKYFTKTVRQ